MKTLNISKECPRWMYEAFRSLESNARQTSLGLQAVDRGETPFSGGGSLGGVVDHGQLLGLTPDDDHIHYALLRGRVGGQILNGGTSAGAPAGSWGASNVFISDGSSAAASVWTTTVIDGSASVGRVIVLCLATRAVDVSVVSPTASTYHTSITDTQGNTWTKLLEYQYNIDPTFPENGQINSIWVCRVTTALTIAVDTLTITCSTTIPKKAISSRVFTATIGATISLAGVSTLGESDDNIPGPLPPGSLTLSGLASAEYLWVRHTAIKRTGGVPEGYTQSSGYLDFYDTAPQMDECQAAQPSGICAFSEHKIATGTSETTDPGTTLTFGECLSVMVALSINATIDGTLTLRAYDNTSASDIVLSDTTNSYYAADHYFYPIGGSTVKLWIRGSDGTIFGSTSTTDPLTGNWLDLIGYNDPPIAGTTGIASRSSQITISTDVQIYTDNLYVTERSTDYTKSQTAGFAVLTGSGFANARLDGGTLTLAANAAGGSPQLLVDNTATGSSNAAVLIKVKAKSSQNFDGYLTGWYNSANTIMSYIRGTDGAFVGPVVPSGAGSSMFVPVYKWGVD